MQNLKADYRISVSSAEFQSLSTWTSSFQPAPPYHHDQQHDGHVQARVLYHRVQRAAEKQADVQRDNLIPPVSRPEVTGEKTQRPGVRGLHSFTLKLNLSNARTPSGVKLR
jgi:hypothetical protein